MTIIDEMVEKLRERVQQFNAMELPGQPLGVHMGTHRLVNDLWRALKAALSGKDRPND